MNNLVAISQEHNLSQDFANTLQASFNPLFEQAKSLSVDAKKIVVTNENQIEEMKLAREKRLILKEIRVETEKKRKELKDESLRTGKAIDGMANIIKFLIVPIEDHLQLQEDFVKIQEEKRKTALAEKRISELSQYELELDGYDFKEMPESTYQQLLSNCKIAHEQKIAQAKKEEEERIEADKKRIAEEKRIREENEKLKKEAEERAKKQKIEDEKRAREKAKLEEKLKKEAEARRKLEKEIKAKEDAEKKEKEEAERKAQEEELARLKAEKEARLAPDKEKMRTVYKAIHEFGLSFRIADFETQEAQEVLMDALEKITEAKQLIAERMKNL